MYSTTSSGNGERKGEPETSDLGKLKEEPLNLRYKLSQPDIIFEEICSSETCGDSTGEISSSDGSTLNTLSDIQDNSTDFRGPAHSFLPTGAAVSPELKRTEFMAYLRKSGFVTAIANIILTLYEMDTLPEDHMAIESIARMLGYGLTTRLELPVSIAYKETLEKEIVKYQRERDILRRVLDNFESSQTEIELVDPERLPPLELLESGEAAVPFARKVQSQAVAASFEEPPTNGLLQNDHEVDDAENSLDVIDIFGPRPFSSKASFSKL